MSHQDSGLPQRFEAFLVQAIEEVLDRTRMGLRGIRWQVESAGPLKWAHTQLADRAREAPWMGSFDYFRATKRIGRMDLSVEAMARDPNWAPLFSPEEVERAKTRLSEQGFDPFAISRPVVENREVESGSFGFAPLRLSKSFSRQADQSYGRGCDLTANISAELFAQRHPPVFVELREHIERCDNCRKHSEITEALADFDRRAWRDLVSMLSMFAHFFLDEPSRASEDWYRTGRAQVVACLIGEFMQAFESTFPEQGELWMKWWRDGELPFETPTRDTQAFRNAIRLALCARNVSWCREAAAIEDGVLWLPVLPHETELSEIPGILRFDRIDSAEGPDDIINEHLERRPVGDDTFLRLMFQSADWQLGHEDTAAKPLVQPSGIDRFMEGQARLQYQLDATTSYVQGIGDLLRSTDITACEVALREKLPGVFDRLHPSAQENLLAFEQNYRTPTYASGGALIHLAALAWELQFKASHWDLSRLGRKADPVKWRFTIGDMVKGLEGKDSHWIQHFKKNGFDLDATLRAAGEVYSERNDATHGHPYGPMQARAILKGWFDWEGKRGGIFSVFFPIIGAGTSE